MTTTDATTRSGAFHSLVRHNPFYFISAALMLLGCLLLINSLSWSSIRTERLLGLIFILQFYEGILIALGLYLLRCRKLEYDGGTLLVLSAFFMVDVTFLSGEIANAHRSIGLIVNLCLVLLAMAKLAIIFYYLSLPVASRAWVLSMVQVVVLLSTGVVFKRLDGHFDQLPAAVLYLSWWIVALLPVALTFIRPIDLGPYRRLVSVFVVLPLISLIAHLATSNFVFDVRWYNANIASLLLGLAVAVARMNWSPATAVFRRQCQFVLPVAALLLAANSSPNALTFHSGVMLNPLRLTGAACVFVWAHAAWMFAAPFFAVLAVGAVLGGLVSANWMLIRTHLREAIAWMIITVDRIWPRTRAHWGIVAMTLSFVSLAIGAAISLRRRPHPPESLPLDVVSEPT